MNQETNARVKTGWRRGVIVCVVAGAAGFAAGLSGCDRRDAVDEAIKSAEIQLGTVNLAGAMPLPSDSRRKGVYEGVLNTLKGAGGSAGPGQEAAVNMLTGRAHAGLAEIQSGKAAEGESAFLAEIIRARSVLDKWQSQNASADALDVYDPTKDLSDLDKQIEERSREAQDMASKQKAQEQLVSGLRAQAEEVQGRAKTIREQETALRTQARGTAAVSRAALIEQSAERRRAADDLDKQASELLAKASIEAPKVEEFSRQVTRLKTQQDLLRQAQAEIRSRVETSRQNATRAREDAKSAGTEVAQLLTTLATTREGLAGPSDTAVSGYTQAVAAAKKAASAGKDTKAAAMVAAGSFQQSLADVLATKARGQMSFAGLVQAAADAKPALTGAASWKEKAKAANDQASATVKDAEEAYKSALGMFEGAGAGDKAKNVSEALKRLLEEKSKASLDPKAIEQEVRDAIAARAKLSPEDAMKDVVFKNEDTKTTMESIAPMTSKLSELRAAAKEKFGKPLEELIKSSENPAIKGNPILGGLAGQGGMGLPGMSGDTSSLPIEVQGVSKAKVDFGALGKQEFTKVDGVWKLNLELPGAMLQQMKMMKPMLDGLSGAVDGVATKTKAGEYADADAMLQDLASQVMASAMGGGKPAADKGAGKGAGKGAAKDPAKGGDKKP